jgi:hypothetical protein
VIHELLHGSPLARPRSSQTPPLAPPTPADQDDIAELALCGEPASPEELEAIFGVPELPITEVTDDALLSFNRPEVRAVGEGRRGIGLSSRAAVWAR